MIYGWDLMTAINLLLSVMIMAVGCFGYAKSNNKAPYYIGAAFGLFAISHLITLFNLTSELAVTMILIRIFGYLIVLFSLPHI